MNSTLRNIIAAVAGWLGGSAVNMGLVEVGHNVMPIPGLSPTDMEAYAALIPTLEPKFFLFPFLAHALGTLAGAFIAASIAVNHKMRFALGIGAFFFLGGLVINYMLPGQLWFTLVDLIFAYFPMAWLGGKLASRHKERTA